MSVLLFECLTLEKIFLGDTLGSQFNEKFKIYENPHVMTQNVAFKNSVKALLIISLQS